MARGAACRGRAERPGSASRPPLAEAREEPQQLHLQSWKVALAGLRLEVDHQVQSWKLAALLPSPVDLSDPALEPLADDRFACLAAGGDAEARVPELVRREVEDGQRSVPPPSRPVAPEVVRPPPQSLRGGQALARRDVRRDGRTLPARHQTLRRLRPFWRRRASTARP